MPLWGKVDNAANSTIYAAAQVHKTPNTVNQTALFDNTTQDAFITGQAVGQFGVSASEASAANGVTHAGWVLRTVGSGGRAGRVFHETLVAGGSISGDAEDTAYPDYRIVFSAQPQGNTIGTGNAVTLSVTAYSVPATTLTYKWQKSYAGLQAWTDVPNTGIFSGNTTSSLRITNNATMNANTFRVVVTAGDTTSYSSNARIIVL